MVGVFLYLKYVSVSMASCGSGVIVNRASIAGMLGPRNMAAYAASKHAVVGLTKMAAKDLDRHGMRVCAVAQGQRWMSSFLLQQVYTSYWKST